MISGREEHGNVEVFGRDRNKHTAASLRVEGKSALVMVELVNVGKPQRELRDQPLMIAALCCPQDDQAISSYDVDTK
jgi:hypothetical protein